ncbi:MAG: hypothetical protein ABIU63_07560 [Chitinophagaceae bacterium]
MVYPTIAVNDGQATAIMLLCKQVQKEKIVLSILPAIQPAHLTIKLLSMNTKQFFVLMVFPIFIASCHGQGGKSGTTTGISPAGKLVGGGCDGCELMFVGMSATIKPVDTSAGWKENGQKLLVSGVTYHRDGKTAAPNTVIYYWQTDNNGYYSPPVNTQKEATKHGHIRGWVKTGDQGQYAIYTIRPAPYPDHSMPAHIHIAIKEPGIKDEYYIDEFVFDDDPLLTPAKRQALENRGGSGILKLGKKDDLQTAAHNIILGLNIPNYPRQEK